MEQKISDMSARLSEIELEYQVAMRARTDGVAKAYRVLSTIPAETVKKLEGVAPTLAVVVTYSQQQLLENLNGEVEMVGKAAQELASYIEHRLTFYEEQL